MSDIDYEEVLNLQIAEMEYIESAYGNELTIESLDELNSMRKSQSGELKLVKPLGLRFTLKFDSFHLWVSLPSSYPHTQPIVNISTKNYDNKNLQIDTNAKIRELHLRSMGDEIYISEIIEWINDNLCRYKIEGKDSIQFQDWKNEEITFLRYWIYSHHIYSNEKRRNMAQLSDNLDLHGFILPGKPGIICIEGTSKQVQEFYAHIRRWNWQHLEIKHEESCRIKHGELSKYFKFDSVTELKFRVTGLRQNHQDLGEFRKFLESRISYLIALFNQNR